MKTISISNDIVPIAEFKTGISKWFKSIQKAGHPLIITQNGKPAGVLLSPTDYDELVYKKAFLDSVGNPGPAHSRFLTNLANTEDFLGRFFLFPTYFLLILSCVGL